MTVFSAARLEGKALEQCLGGSRSFGIRMYDESLDKWVVVRDARSTAALQAVRPRAATLKSELQEAGLTVLGVDQPVKVERGDKLSVDVRVWVRERGTSGLLDMKWTRQSLSVAVSDAKKKFPKLREACDNGKWVQCNGKVGKPVKACVVGALAVGPSLWRCDLQATNTDDVWRASYPEEVPLLTQRAKKTGWYNYRGDAKPGDEKWPFGKSNWEAHNVERAARRLATLAKKPAVRTLKKPARSN
jgi:hypothetical protein